MYTGSIQKKPNPRPQKQQTKKETTKLQPHHPKNSERRDSPSPEKVYTTLEKTEKRGSFTLTSI